MADGTTRTQTFFTEKVTRWSVSHELLSSAEVDTVIAFLEGNAGIDFTLIDPLSGKSYDGKAIGKVGMRFKSDVHYSLSWEFSGRESP